MVESAELDKDLNSFLAQVEQWGQRSEVSRCSPRRLTAGLSTLNVSATQPAMELKDYQREGVEWMLRKQMASVNCILADEMGLGKTIQSIAFMACLNHRMDYMGPHIVIVPKSVLTNWQAEFKTWYPQLRVLLVLCTKDERSESMAKLKLKSQFDVCLISYDSVSRSVRYLRKFHWKLMIIDEAHRIKNPSSKFRKDLTALSAKHKVLLTGTPMQMNMTEMWSLLNFLAPELFNSQEQFELWFKAKKGEDNSHIVKQIRTAIEPFVLRRLKTEAEPDLPIKREIQIYASLTPLQRSIYKTLLRKTYSCSILMHLRKACNHPYLFPKVEDPTWSEERMISNSGKLKLLDKLLPKLKEVGSKVLIFSQMTTMLDILEDYCCLRGYSYMRLCGRTNLEDRTSSIKAFNQPGDPTFLFLLSTRAGGLGVNLVAADTVIIYDSDWNPQSDLQAMDRAHRIGQIRQVNVIRLITKGTIEEKMIEKQLLRLKLSHMILEKGLEGRFEETLGSEETKNLIAYGANAILKGQDEENQGDVPDEDLEMVLTRGEQQAKLMEEKVEAAFREKEQVLETFEQVTNFFTFEPLVAAVPEGIEQVESREGSFIPTPKAADAREGHVSPPPGTNSDFTEFTISSQTLSSSTARPGSYAFANEEEGDKENSVPVAIPRRRSPTPARGSKRFKNASKSSK